MNILIKNGRILDPKNNRDEIGDIFIRDGIIADYDGTSQYETVDADGLWVVPGLIDLHTHLREPGFLHKETIRTGTEAAAAGGFTSVCCMPNTNPVVDNEILVEYVRLISSREAKVNVFPIGAVTKGQNGTELANIAGMAKAGACALSEDGKSVANAAVLKSAMKYASMFDLPVFSHCEDASLAGTGQMNAGTAAELLGLAGISNDSEDVIIARDIILAKAAGIRLHICHISTAGGVFAVETAQKLGLPVTAEVTPHHFTLCDSDIINYDTNFKMNPPLRSKDDVDAVRRGLQQNIIQVIATDHAPHSEDEKNAPFEAAPYGIVGLETAVALTITGLVETGILTPLQMIEKMSSNPAAILGLPSKGTLSVGADADITLIDAATEYSIDKQTFRSKGRNTPFHGKKVRGKAVCTIVGGKIVMKNGEIF